MGTAASTSATWTPPDAEQHQVILDSAHDLLDRRRHALGRIDGGHAPRGAAIVASGGDLATWTMRDSTTWTHVLSTRSVTRFPALSRSMPNNRSLIRAGLTMRSLFDYLGTDDDARRLLQAEDDDAYLFGSAPVDVRIIDRRRVLLHGGPSAILELTGATAVAAAHRYWDAVVEAATPCRSVATGQDDLTARQVAVLDLLRRGITDEQVSRALGLSVRTIRAEVAEAMRRLDAPSRFAAGYRYAEHAAPSA